MLRREGKRDQSGAGGGGETRDFVKRKGYHLRTYITYTHTS